MCATRTCAGKHIEGKKLILNRNERASSLKALVPYFSIWP